MCGQAPTRDPPSLLQAPAALSSPVTPPSCSPRGGALRFAPDPSSQWRLAPPPPRPGGEEGPEFPSVCRSPDFLLLLIPVFLPLRWGYFSVLNLTARVAPRVSSGGTCPLPPSPSCSADARRASGSVASGPRPLGPSLLPPSGADRGAPTSPAVTVETPLSPSRSVGFHSVWFGALRLVCRLVCTCLRFLHFLFGSTLSSVCNTLLCLSNLF